MGYRRDKDNAFNEAVQLAKINLESTQTWVNPEDVNKFIEEVYKFLSSDQF